MSQQGLSFGKNLKLRNYTLKPIILIQIFCTQTDGFHFQKLELSVNLGDIICFYKKVFLVHTLVLKEFSSAVLILSSSKCFSYSDNPSTYIVASIYSKMFVFSYFFTFFMFDQ